MSRIIKNDEGQLKPNCAECPKHYQCSGLQECLQVMYQYIWDLEHSTITTKKAK